MVYAGIESSPCTIKKSKIVNNILYFCIVLLNGVEVTQKIFRTIPHCSSKPSVFHRWVFYFTKMAKEIQLTQGKVAIVDDEDFDFLNQFNWQANKNGNTFYVNRNFRISNNKQGKIYMHRLILNAKKEYVIDHIDGDALNNQKNNLRICTHAENMRNSQIPINNTSGYKGVSYNKRYKKWEAHISFNNKLLNLGSFIDPIDAARAYNAAAIKYHGEFAHINKID
jgi:hypothetical protein